MRTRIECCLCSQIAGEEQNDLIARMLPNQPYVRRVMLETTSFAVIPSLGPLTPGHCLACPKRHVRSFAQLEEAESHEFSLLKDQLRVALKRLYGTGVHVFEHGAAVTGSQVLCSVDHAHMHFVPMPAGFEIDSVRQLNWVCGVGSLQELLCAAAGREYIFYEDACGAGRILPVHDGEFESQFMRKLFADVLPVGRNWNWREDPDPAAADIAWRRFIGAACWESRNG